MKPRTLSGLLRHITCAFLFIVSPACFAIGNQVLQQPAHTIEIALYAVAALIVILLILLFIARSNVKRAKQQQELANADLTAKDALLDGFNLGMVHLNATGQILYSNRIAAYYLGEKDSALLNKKLTEQFQQEDSSDIEQAFSSKVQTSIQLYSSLRERHLKLTFNPLQTPRGELANILSIEDVSEYQVKLDASAAEQAHYQNLVVTSQLGEILVDLQEETYVFSDTILRLLGVSEDKQQGTINQLKDLVYPSDVHAFTLAITNAQQGTEVDLACRFVTTNGNLHTQVYGVSKLADDKGLFTQVHLTVNDQSAMRQLQLQSHKRQQRTKGLLSSSKHSLYLLDADGNIEECNHAFENMFGVHLSDIRGKNIKQAEFFPEELKKLHPLGDMQFSSVSSGTAKEIELARSAGDIRALRVKVQGYKDDDGNRAGLVGMIEDVTEFRQTVKALEHERAHFRAILDKAPVAIAMIDHEDQVIQTNKVMTDRLGLDEKELKKRSFYQLFNDPNNSGKAAKILHQTGQLRDFQAKLKGQDDSLHPSEINIDIFDKEKQQYLCWIADITDQQFHQDKFQGLLEHSSMPMAVLEEKGFTQLNPAACKFFSAADEYELFGVYPYSDKLSEDEGSSAELQKIIEQIKTDGKAQSMVWQHKVNEEHLPCQATYVPMFKGESLISILCIWTDLRAITKADQARLEAINLHQAAERQVAEQRQLLEVSQDQLASKAKSLQDTQSRLHAAEEDISAKQSEISDLQQANQDVTEHLQQLQNDYSASRDLLASTQRSNEELEEQLQQSSVKVTGLEKQRNQIADALQYSERQFQQAKLDLEESEKTTRRLEQEQLDQQQKIDQFVTQIDDLKGSIDEKDQQINAVSGQIKSLQTQLVSSSEAGNKLRELLINQRKASEQAELQHRELEQTYRSAQSELSLKARHLEHLQHEMQKFEEMSNQEKGDMQQQQALLAQELEDKQQQLMQTQQALDETKQQAEQEKADSAEQQRQFEQLQNELKEVEQRTRAQQEQIAEADQQFQQQQLALQKELQEKQQRLQETEQILSEAKQQTEAEKAEKARQQEIFDQLKAELAEVEQRTEEQNRVIAESDQQWQQNQQALQQELEAKQQQLHDTQQKLNENQRQAEIERSERELQQQTLEQLKVELTDVESRASKQKELMEGSDEQWREHHAEIERQKQQLQQALAEAEQQNEQMQHRLEENLHELKRAESKVSDTQTGEQKLQQELEQAKQDAEQLQQKLAQQEAQESHLQAQLDEQQHALQSREQNIQHLEQQQQALTQKLQTVQDEYANSQQNLNEQDSEQSQLAEQLKSLEHTLQSSQQQLEDKEKALQSAQRELENSQQKLVEQEQALVDAHKHELKQAQQQEPAAAPMELPEYAKLPMPDQPDQWFDLLHYLQQNPNSGPLAEALGSLIKQFEGAMDATDKAVENDDNNMILFNTRKLVMLISKLNSHTLSDFAQRLNADCERGEVDNIAIFWPNVKKSLMTTLKVIHSHLYA